MKRIIMASLTAVVVIAVLAGALIPVLDDATATTDTYKNPGLFNYGVFKPTDTYNLQMDATNGVITVNDSAVSLDFFKPGVLASYSIISSDDFLVRLIHTTDNTYNAQIIHSPADPDDEDIQATDTVTDVTGLTTASFTITNGALSATLVGNSTKTGTYTFTEFYGIVSDEDVAVLKVSTGSVYILGDSELYASGITNVGSWYNMIHFDGTYEDGITITSPNMPGATFDNITWNIEKVDGYVSLYKLTSVEFDVTYGDSTVHAIYSYFAVPSEVDAEKSVHFTDGENAIFNAIPVMVIIALLLGVVALVLRSRMD